MCIYLFVLNCSDSFKDHKSAADDPNYSTSKFEDMSEDDVIRYIYIKFKDCYEGTHFCGQIRWNAPRAFQERRPQLL